MSPAFLLLPLRSGARINLFAFLIDPLGPAQGQGGEPQAGPLTQPWSV